MSELVRTSRRWIVCGEYHADEPTGSTYRGYDGLLFKRDWPDVYGSCSRSSAWWRRASPPRRTA